MTKRQYITLTWLDDHEACSEERQKFIEVFGQRAKITLPNLLEAAAHDFNLLWLAKELLSLAAANQIEIDMVEKDIFLLTPLR